MKLGTATSNEYTCHPNQNQYPSARTPLWLGCRQTTRPARARYEQSVFQWGHRLAPQASDLRRPRLFGYLREDQPGKSEARTRPALFGFAVRLRPRHPMKMIEMMQVPPTRVKSGISLWLLWRTGDRRIGAFLKMRSTGGRTGVGVGLGAKRNDQTGASTGMDTAAAAAVRVVITAVCPKSRACVHFNEVSATRGSHANSTHSKPRALLQPDIVITSIKP